MIVDFDVTICLGISSVIETYKVLQVEPQSLGRFDKNYSKNSLELNLSRI
jgi:hypothetical protein